MNKENGKVSLGSLKVESFITSLGEDGVETVKGGLRAQCTIGSQNTWCGQHATCDTYSDPGISASGGRPFCGPSNPCNLY